MSISNILENKFSDRISIKEDNCFLLSSKSHLLIDDMTFLREKVDFICLVDIAGVDNQEREIEEAFFELNYFLLNLEDHLRIQVKLKFQIHDEISSVSNIWKSASWHEKEVCELFGILIKGVDSSSFLLPTGFQGHPLRKNFKESTNEHFVKPPLPQTILPLIGKNKEEDFEWVNFGPGDSSHGLPLNVFFQLKGEIVESSRLEIGFLHRGVEKMAEKLSYHQFIPYTDRLNFKSAGLNNFAWTMTLEKALKIKVPERGSALRMLLSELSRIGDHFLTIADTARDAKFSHISHLALQMRKSVSELFAQYCGAELTVSMATIGGVRFDLPSGWSNNCLSVVKTLEKGLLELESELVKGRLWIEKVKSGPFLASKAVDWGFSGPCLRACGVNYDLRKARPYDFYSDVEFEIPLGINGDGYDRFLVRLHEIRESIKIVVQVLDNLPKGRFNLGEEYYPFEERRNKENIDFFKTLPRGEWYHSLEAANGELGFFIISEGGETPYRVKIKAPSFNLAQSYSSIVKGLKYEDALLTLNSLALNPTEMDR